MTHEIICDWNKEMFFEADTNGHMVKMDANEAAGGRNNGPRPKPLLLTALAGCTGMDVASMVKKMRQKVDDFQIKVEGEMTEEHPKYYRKIHLIYRFKGQDLDPEKLKKAVDLSQDKYCGISAMLKKAAELSYEIEIAK